MFTWLTFSVLCAASPQVAAGADGKLTVDGRPLAEASAELRAAGRALLPIASDSRWESVAPQIDALFAHGVRSLGLQLDDAKDTTWLTLQAGTDPVIAVDRSAHLLHGGATVNLAFTDSRWALLWRAFPHASRPCLLPSAATPAKNLGVLAKTLRQSAGDRPMQICLLRGDDVARLSEVDRVVLARLRDEDVPSPSPTPTGFLTQWFGQSRSPVVEEVEVPRWTRASSLLCQDEGGAQIWGIGSVSGVRNHALARSTSDNRARAEIAKALAVEIAKSPGRLATRSAMTLSGVQIVDHFLQGDTVWSLASVATDAAGAQPCPTGKDVKRAWRWQSLAPDGTPGSERPEWARKGVARDETRLWRVVSESSVRPVDESETLLVDLARRELGVALLRTVLTVPRTERKDWGGDCLLTFPWAEVADTAAVETWYDTESGLIYARANLDLTELRGALAPGCDAGLVDGLADGLVATKEEISGVRAPVASKKVDYPEWVLRGSGPFGEGKLRVFLGVGSASGIANHALARTTADNRARAEIAKVFEVYSASTMVEYLREAPDAISEPAIEQAIKTFSAVTLSGVQIVDHWFHPDGTVYALAQLDLETFTFNIAKGRKLDAQVLDYVQKNAERIHQMLEREEKTRSGH